MSEKFYVVSETELCDLQIAEYSKGFWDGHGEPVADDIGQASRDAVAACRSRSADKIRAVVEASKKMYDEWEKGQDSRNARFDYIQALAALEEDL